MFVGGSVFFGRAEILKSFFEKKIRYGPAGDQYKNPEPG
jgi:hypothetical protein